MLSLLTLLIAGAGITYPPLTVQDEGTPLPVEMRLNMVGTPVTCVDDAANGRTTCTVTGGGATSPLTTKGDLWTYSTVDARLGVGGDGNCLKADSTQATGLIWGACSTGSANFIAVDVNFTSTGNTTAKTVVTGAGWVTGTSKIVCSATGYASTGRTEGAEDVLLEDITVMVSNRVASTGFTLTAHPSLGKAYNVYTFNCTGL